MSEEANDKMVYEKVEDILDRITLLKVKESANKIKQLEINTEEHLRGVTDLIYNKAIILPSYAKICALLSKELSVLKVPSDTKPDGHVNFRAFIINKCQKEFETTNNERTLSIEKEMDECNDPVKWQELKKLLDEENRCDKMSAIGNVIFIGELFKVKLLTSKIIYYCLENCLQSLEDKKLECLCELLTVVGEDMENDYNSKLNVTFQKLQDIVDRNTKKNSSTVIAKIERVIALRNSNWE